MKLPPHARSLRSARPSRASTVGGYARSLAASASIHLLLMLTLPLVELPVGVAPGSSSGRTFTVAASARGVSLRPSVFGSVPLEVERGVEGDFREPVEFESAEISLDLGSDERYFDDHRVKPAFETSDRFARLLLSSTLVQPTAVEPELFTESVAALGQREEPASEQAEEVAVVEATAAVETAAEAEGAGSSATEQPARIVLGLPPAYPKVALRMGWEGSVLCAIDIDASGQVLDVRVEESSGYDALDEAALAAIRAWRFAPGSLEGRLTRTSITHTIRFQISG